MSKMGVISGVDAIPDITDRIVQAIRDKDITLGADIDGTLVHAVPGEHRNVLPEHDLVGEFNNLYDITGGQAFVLTGRPYEFVKNALPGRKFLAGTEHGSVISSTPDAEQIVRIGNVQAMTAFREAVKHKIGKDPLLDGVQIEDYKTVTATLGFTPIINKHGKPEIGRKATRLMGFMQKAVVNLAHEGVVEADLTGVDVVDTVTPTNAVVEVMPQGACKAESLQHLRDKGNIRKTGLTVFMGDSGGDATVMRKVFNEGGICLGVGPKAPDTSHVVFDRPEDLRHYLREITADI